MIGRMLDAAIAAVAPQWAAGRVRARAQYEALSAYAAAERSRRNRDWVARDLSADSAILGDFNTLLPRARSMVRDNWASRSAVKAYGRNVIGCGMTAASVAKDPAGKERREYNERRDWLFNHWARRAKFSDVERKQSFFRKQKMAVEEMVGVGEHFVLWSYTPNPEAVGLRLQSYEPEQLDIAKVTEPTTGNEVRRGIEVDQHGAPVAYHFYPRPLNDYFGWQPAGVSGSLYWTSERFPASRVFHVFDQERTRQTHGATWLAPAMAKFRDVDKFDDATLQKARLEASIALKINKQPSSRTSLPTRVDGPGPGGASSTPDDTSSDGGRQYQIEPVMVFEGLKDETLDVVPQQNGGQNYDPFVRANIRAGGAGIGLSYDVIARDFDQGSYSSKRQAALEDRREYGWIQDLVLMDQLCQPVIELFTLFAVIEGRLPVDPEFWRDPAPWQETEWLPDGFEWIDPAKEAAAASIRLDKRLDTRKNIIGGRGGNWRRTFQQLADEQREATLVGITLPDVEPAAPSSAGDAPPKPAPGDGKGGPAAAPAGNKPPAANGDGKPLSGSLVERILLDSLDD